MLALGAVATVLGHRRYKTAGVAIRAGRRPPPGHGPALITAGVAVLAACVIAVYLLT